MVPPHCVKGRAKSEPHRVNKEADDETIPTVAMHYVWMKSKDEEKHKADDEDQEMRGMIIFVLKLEDQPRPTWRTDPEGHHAGRQS